MEVPARCVFPLSAKTSGTWAFSVTDLSIFQLADLCNKLNPHQDWDSDIQAAVALSSMDACIYSYPAKILD